MMPLGHLGIPLLVPIIGKNIRIDVRLLLIGSILPDIIDKPLGHLLLPGDNGRIFAHTLLFALSVLLIGLVFRPVLSLSIGVSFHHILDGMFLDPETSFWPLLGPFQSYDFQVSQWLEAFTEPFTVGEEVIGLLLICIFIYLTGAYRIDNALKLLRGGKLR